jgi:hypothetical protein
VTDAEELKRLQTLVLECATAIELFAKFLPVSLAHNATQVAKMLRDASARGGKNPCAN